MRKSLAKVLQGRRLEDQNEEYQYPFTLEKDYFRKDHELPLFLKCLQQRTCASVVWEILTALD